MLKKVAIDKNEMDKLIKLKKYKEAFDYIAHVRSVIEIVSKTRVNKFIENKIILDKEKEVFLSLIQNNINNKLLEDENYILIDESYIEIMEERLIKLKALRERKKLTRKKISL